MKAGAMKNLIFTAFAATSLATLLATTAMAQISAPRLGLLPDSGAIRAMNGIAGSGSIGPLLGNGQTFTSVAVAPSGEFAVGATSDGNVWVVTVDADGVTLDTAQIAGAGVGNIQMSPNGSAALIVSGAQLQVVTGLPASPSAQAAVDTTYLGAASALAVSDDGQWVAGVFGGAVFALGTGGQSIPLPAPAGVSAVSFFHATDDLAITTGIQVLQISNIGGTPAASSIYGSADSPPASESPIAIAMTADNGTVVIIEPDGSIGQVVLASGTATIAQCGCTPQGLVGLGGSVFRLNNLDSGVVKVYDAASGDVLFVPLAASGTQGGQQ
jgi:hypothetical protein